MSDLKFTKDHEWLAFDDNIVTIGITDYAQDQLGDVVFVELPEVGQTITQGAEVAVIESVKAAGEINAPVNGTIVEVNEELADAPETVNQDPTGTGWFFKARVDGEPDISEFLSEDEYLGFVGEG